MCLWHFLCCIIWNCCVTLVGEHLQFIACMFRDVIIIISATVFSGSKINNENLHLVLAVLQLWKYFCRLRQSQCFQSWVDFLCYNVLWTFISCQVLHIVYRFVSCVINGVSPSPKGAGAGSAPLNPPLTPLCGQLAEKPTRAQLIRSLANSRTG